MPFRIPTDQDRADLVTELRARQRLGERLVLLNYEGGTRHIVACLLGYTEPDRSPRWQFVADVSNTFGSYPYITRTRLEGDNNLGVLLSEHRHRVVVWRWLTANDGYWELEPEE